MKHQSILTLLSCWFVPSFYAYIFELACKGLLSCTNTLTSNSNTKCEAVNLLKAKYTQLEELPENFDHFLRNAIDHSQYIVTDVASAKIEAWNVRNGMKTEKRSYDAVAVFRRTVRVVFFVIAMHASFYEIIEAQSRMIGFPRPLLGTF